MCFAEALTEGTPAYIRIGKKEVEKVHDAQPNFQSTNHGLIPIRVSNNSEILLVSYGTISTEVFHAWQVLRKDTEIDFWTLPRLKPNEISEITKLITTYRVIVAVEEHRSTGGMTALLLEAASLSGAPRPELVFINSGDKFHTGLGNQNQARKSLGLDSDSIVRKVRSLV
jgi:transketolase C-terminal domain/subunit